MDKRPNFFEVLELAPQFHDWPTIESAILSKTRQWSQHRNQGTPRQRRLAEKYTLLINEMTEYLQSEENVKQELKAYKQLKAKTQQVNLKKLEDLVDTLGNKFVPKALIKKLVLATDKAFTEQEIENHLKAKGFEIEGATRKTPSRAPLQQLDASVAKEINEQLAAVNYPSLYEFLADQVDGPLTNRSSAGNLFDRADEIYKQLSALGKTDQETTIRKQLAGHAKAVFKTDTDKTRYDNTLALEVVEQLNPYIEVAGADGFIEVSELETLLQQAKRRNIDSDIALNHIESIANKRKWGIQRQSNEEKSRLLLCGHCNSLAQTASQTRCQDCGQPLVEPCPHCNHPTPTEQAACTECGCHVGDAPFIRSLYKQSQVKATAQDLQGALALIERVLHYWPKWQDAINLKKRWEASERQQREFESELSTLVRQKRLLSAQDKLHYLKQNGLSPALMKMRSEIEKGIAKANQHFSQAESSRKNGQLDSAFEHLEAALHNCTDHNQAKKALAELPPPSPQHLNAQWRGATLRLSWSEPKAKGQLCYDIVRKPNGIPANPKDGQLVAQIYACEADDSSVEPGIAYYYAVFTRRGEATSLQSAHAGPYLRTSDVEQLTFNTGDAQVAIKWRNPHGCAAVEIWRNRSGMPPRDGQLITPSDESYLDSGLTNGQGHDYLVQAKFPDPLKPGHFLCSKGIGFSATPLTPPKPVSDLRVKRQGQQVVLEWTPIPGPAHVELRQTDILPAFVPGQTLSRTQAASCGSLIGTSGAGHAQAPIEYQGRIYFIPLTVQQQTTTYGKPVELTTLDDVTNARSVRQGKSISLTWQWPPGAKAVQVFYRHDKFPTGSSDQQSSGVRVTKAEYDDQGFLAIRNTEKKKHYFMLFVYDPQAQVCSRGVALLETMGQECTVRYQLAMEKGWFSRRPSKAWIELNYQEGRSLPGLIVVLKPKYPPTTKDDGTKILQLDELVFMDNIARIDIPSQYLGSESYIKLFFADNESAKEVRLLPMAKEKLRL